MWSIAGWSIDLSTVALLAAVLWLDGWRKISNQTILVARVGLGPWTVGVPSARLGTFGLVAWWPPIVMPMLLPLVSTPGVGDDRRRPEAEFGAAVDRARRQLRRVHAAVTTLRVLGTLLTLWIVIGIPLLTGRFGAIGLFRGIAAAFVLAFGLTVIATSELMRLGVPFRSAIRRSIHLLSPFSACRAPEVVVAGALDEPAALVRVAALLGETRFLAWVRPWAYDVLHGREDSVAGEPSMLVSLARGLPLDVLEQAASVPSMADGDVTYCPRCARTYRGDVTTCAECGEIALAK